MKLKLAELDRYKLCEVNSTRLFSIIYQGKLKAQRLFVLVVMSPFQKDGWHS